jgi:hypothetical protein
MKTNFNKLKIQAAALMALNLFSIGLSAQKGLPANFSDSLLCLEISGKIQNVETNDNEYIKVVLVHYNTPVDSIQVKGNRSFKFKLVKDAYYAIKIYKNGYAPRLISICTNLPEEVCNDRLLRFHFTTSLVNENKFAELNQEARDFPIAIVSFNRIKKAFYYNTEYTSNIKKSLYQNETFASY